MAKSFVKLDRRELRKLKPGTMVMEHGLEFTRLANGDGRYAVNVMVDGQRIHRVIGLESDGTTRTQAEEFIEKVRTDARHDRLALPRGRKIALSFKDAAKKYLAAEKEANGKNLDSKTAHLNLHLVPFFDSRPLSKISSFEIERYKKHRLTEVAQAGGDRRGASRKPRLEGKTTSPGTINRELATLSHLFTQALEWKWITTAKPKMKHFDEGNGRIVYLSTEQVDRLKKAAKNSDNPQLYAFVFTAVDTSMRRSEVLSIQLANIDAKRRVIYIPKAKAGAREQPITQELADFLDKYIEESRLETDVWLFPSSKSESGHAESIEKPFRRAVIEAGMDPKQVLRHTLRHTAISHLVQSGVDLPTVKRVSGHKTLKMIERYAHQDGDHIQEAMDKLQQRYANKEKRSKPRRVA